MKDLALHVQLSSSLLGGVVMLYARKGFSAMKRWMWWGSMGIVLVDSAMAAESPSLPSQLWGEEAEVDAGMVVSSMPKYMGSKDDTLIIWPALSVYRGIFFADIIRGIGVEYLSENQVYGSLSISYDLGRLERNSSVRPGGDRLKGMGDVRSAATANVLLSVPFNDWLSVNAEADMRIAGEHRGNRYRAALEVTALDDESDLLTFGVHAHAGDKRYNRTYFGVSGKQALASRYSAFEASSGVHAYSAAVDWHHYFDKKWTLSMGVNAMRYGEQAAFSPIVEDRHGVTGFATLHYRF